MKNPDYIVWSYSMGLIADTGTGGRSLGDVKKNKINLSTQNWKNKRI